MKVKLFASPKYSIGKMLCVTCGEKLYLTDLYCQICGIKNKVTQSRLSLYPVIFQIVATT